MSKKAMLEDLKRSGLSTADATRLKLKPLTAVQTNKLVNKKLISYELPYFDIKGKKISYSRVRFLESETKFGKEIKTIRYSQPKDSGVHLYIPPLLKWVDIAQDVNSPIIFTEGEKKAAKACREGIPCIGLGGVWSFKSNKKGKMLIDDFKLFKWETREVSLIFDSDLATNPKVMQALVAFSKELTRLGAHVYIAYLPEASNGDKVGLDDYLLTHSVEDLEELEFQEYDKSKGLWELNTEIALIENISAYRVFKNNTMQTRNAIVDSLYADRTIEETTEKGVKRIPLAVEWIKWPLRRTHSKLEYAPGQEEVLENNELNVWEGWGCEPEDGTVKPFYTILEHIIPDEEFREWFLQWLAYPIQNPGTKLFTSVLIHGRNHGTGKSFIGYMIGQVYGVNFQMVDQDDIHSSFNEWAINKQFILGEEITGSDRRREADKIKNMISRESFSINPKGIRQYTMRDCINYYFTSNHADAFFLEDKDRRHGIYETKATPLPEKAYSVIDRWYKNGGTSHLFYHLLNDIDCSKFNPRAPALETSSKRDMIELSRSDLDSFVYALKEDAAHLLIYNGARIDRDLFTVAEIADIYDPEGKHKTSLIAISKSLRRAGFDQLPVTQTKSGAKRLWALNNIDYWKKASAIERVANYDKSVILLDKTRSTKADKFKSQRGGKK